MLLVFSIAQYEKKINHMKQKGIACVKQANCIVSLTEEKNVIRILSYFNEAG